MSVRGWIAHRAPESERLWPRGCTQSARPLRQRERRRSRGVPTAGSGGIVASGVPDAEAGELRVGAGWGASGAGPRRTDDRRGGWGRFTRLVAVGANGLRFEGRTNRRGVEEEAGRQDDTASGRRVLCGTAPPSLIAMQDVGVDLRHATVVRSAGSTPWTRVGSNVSAFQRGGGNMRRRPSASRLRRGHGRSKRGGETAMRAGSVVPPSSELTRRTGRCAYRVPPAECAGGNWGRLFSERVPSMTTSGRREGSRWRARLRASAATSSDRLSS